MARYDSQPIQVPVVSYISSFVESATGSLLNYGTGTTALNTYDSMCTRYHQTTRVPSTQSIQVHIASFVEGAIVNYQCSKKPRQHVWPKKVALRVDLFSGTFVLLVKINPGCIFL